MRARLAALVLIALAAAVAAAAALAAQQAPPPGKILAVTFGGNVGDPVVTVRGIRLGKRPQPNPAYNPIGHPPLCPPEATKPLSAYGYDFGTKLYLVDQSAQPLWAAGRYRPQLSELDCIGLRVTRFTPTRVVFRLDEGYHLRVRNPNGDYHLRSGDRFVVSVNGAQFSGVVHYR